MDHASASELLGVFVLDACEEGEAAEVRLHLNRCAVCALEMVRLRELAGWLGASEAAGPSPELRARVIEEVRGRVDD